jgi:hypothetical protein
VPASAPTPPARWVAWSAVRAASSRPWPPRSCPGLPRPRRPAARRRRPARPDHRHPPETADAVTIVIRPGRGWLGHVPGQYIRIGIDIDGVRQWRAYSLTHRTDGSSAAGIPDGVHRHHDQGDPRRRSPTTSCAGPAPAPWSCSTRPPATSACRPRRPAKVLFLTAGSGITPVMGMLRNQLGELADVAHVHCAPHGIRRDLRRRTATAYAASGRLALTLNARRRTRRARPRPRPRHPRARLARARGLGVRADRPARRRRSPLGRSRARRCPAHRALPPEHHRTR